MCFLAELAPPSPTDRIASNRIDSFVYFINDLAIIRQTLV